MPKRQLGPITIHYAPRDEETPRALEETCAAVMSVSESVFGLRPSGTIDIHVVRTWLGWVFKGVGFPARLTLTLWLPRIWYWGLFREDWRNYHVGFRMTRRGEISLPVKSLAVLPHTLPPHFQPSWQDATDIVDQPTFWRMKLSANLIMSCSARKLPNWIAWGIGSYVERRAVVARPLPKRWPPIMRWTGADPALFDPTLLKTMPQEKRDELAARSAWSGWAVEYLEAAFPGLIKQMIESRMPWQQMTSRAATALGTDEGHLWEVVAGRVVAHFEPNAAADVMPLAIAELAPVSADANPYAPPHTESRPPKLRERRGPSLLSVLGDLVVVLLFVAGTLTGAFVSLAFVSRPLVVVPIVMFCSALAGGLATVWAIQAVQIGFHVLVHALRRRNNGS